MQPRLASSSLCAFNSSFSCLHLSRAGITGCATESSKEMDLDKSIWTTHSGVVSLKAWIINSKSPVMHWCPTKGRNQSPSWWNLTKTWILYFTLLCLLSYGHCFSSLNLCLPAGCHVSLSLVLSLSVSDCMCSTDFALPLLNSTESITPGRNGMLYRKLQ